MFCLCRSGVLDRSAWYFRVTELLWYRNAMNSILAGNLFCMPLIRLAAIQTALLFISCIFHIAVLQLRTKFLKQVAVTLLFKWPLIKRISERTIPPRRLCALRLTHRLMRQARRFKKQLHQKLTTVIRHKTTRYANRIDFIRFFIRFSAVLNRPQGVLHRYMDW